MSVPSVEKKMGTSWARKLAYSIGAIPSGLLYNVIGSYVLMFYQLVLGPPIEYFTLL
jgi:Na+/melibiose symporter-like transporter